MNPRMENTQTFGVFIPVIGVMALICSIVAAAPAAAVDCQVAALSALGVPNMTINSATDVPAAAPNPEYCDVKGSVATSGEGAGPNSAGFEAKLPANWEQLNMEAVIETQVIEGHPGPPNILAVETW